MPGESHGVTAEDKKKMSSSLAELGKLTGVAWKLMYVADAALPGYSKADAEILQMNLQRLRQSAEQAEEVWL